MRVTPHGGEAIYHIDLERSQPETQMCICYADPDGGGFSLHRGNQLRVVVDGKLEVSTYTTDTGG